MSFTDDLGSRFVQWTSALPRQHRVHILCDSDADGLPSGALLAHALRSAGFSEVIAEARLKGESAWNPHVLDRLRARSPEALIVADLGVRSEPLLPGVPTLLLDHHCPTGLPSADTLVLSSYGEGDPTGDGKDVATTGLLAWWCARALVGDAQAQPWLWLAGISLLSDLGDKAPFPELALAKKLYGGGALRDATSLLNAPRRTATGDASAALRLLLQADSPKQVLSGEFPETAELQAAKSEVASALALARKLPPRFSTRMREELGADLIAIRMDTPVQVHPLIATQWRARFPKSVIFGVNTGYRPGWVHFSGRAPAGINLIAWLKAHRPSEADAQYGNGHDQAAGGALPTAAWNRWATDVGFGPEMLVIEA